ncbi:hypothetical protein GGR58DRAFT_476751 [Xylaria digitata]|nr:hypothetical protein GGR58DRAFT_476751 [Xylaria digitata]
MSTSRTRIRIRGSAGNGGDGDGMDPERESTSYDDDESEWDDDLAASHDPEGEHNPESGQRRPEPGQETPLTSAKQKLSESLQNTISDDRSRGSEFEIGNRILTAFYRSAMENNAQPKEDAIKKRAYPKELFKDSQRTPRKAMGPYPTPEPQGLSRPHANGPPSKFWVSPFFAEVPEQGQDLNIDHIDEDPSLSHALRIVRRALNIRDESVFTIETLREYASNIKLIEPRVQLIHRVSKNRDKKMYLDQPQWLAGANFSKEALVGNLPVLNVSSYLSKHPEIICVVYRDYDGSQHSVKDYDKVSDEHSDESSDEDYGDSNRDCDDKIWGANRLPGHNSETIEPINEEITTAIDAFCNYFKFGKGDVAYTKAALLSSPYLPIYHTRRNGLNIFLETLDETQRQKFQVLLDYILTEYEAEYELVESMTGKGKITCKYIKYLFKPGDVVVRGSHQGSRGYLCVTWPEEAKLKKHGCYRLNAWCWKFDGVFSREPHRELILPVDFEDASYRIIDDMDIRPLAYVNESTKERLRQRGAWFWKCRVRHMVSYHEENERGFHGSGHGRYMIDMKMYRELHKPTESSTNAASTDDIGPEAFKRNGPPSDFIYMTPLTIKGYDLKRKKWLDLEVDKIGPVIWNKQAFQHLVIKDKTKRLIQALISNQIEAENSTDLITGKGNGLIMLLHGGPGTGKTLTAESVAEIAEKPLYPVTCGDIGTNPEEVENYLESVLHIGKTWGCVVLLDEADVFLEQRSLEDLRRNALVSVFLRVLEYYDGILVLTSNRVGTFDEAFKSRIQLALHYKNLTEYQRTQIWRNFITRLQEINEDGIDFVDLKDNIEELAKYKLNGREIRNVITTARQYARWERQQPNKQHIQLDYNMMKEVIGTTGEFNQYIEKLNDGYTLDQLAEDGGLRLRGDA